VVFWYIFSRFGILYHEKSGNPARVVLRQDVFAKEKQKQKSLSLKATENFDEHLCNFDHILICVLNTVLNSVELFA
jgi:hypothetical protein